MAKRETVEVVQDIRKAAYLFGTGKHTLAEVAEMLGKSPRTLSRWRRTVIWKEQIALMREEGG